MLKEKNQRREVSKIYLPSQKSKKVKICLKKSRKHYTELRVQAEDFSSQS